MISFKFRMADTTRMYGMDAKDSTIYCAVLFVGWDRVSGSCVPVGRNQTPLSQNGRRILWFRMYLTSSKMRLAGIR